MNDLTTPAGATVASYGELLEFWTTGTAEIDNLNERLDNVQVAKEFSDRHRDELRQKIENVKGYIADIYSEDGEIDERVKDIARLLDIELTKRISGDATFTISWSAQVQIDFDADDFELSFDVDCDTYEAEDFDWQEENTEVNAEEG